MTYAVVIICLVIAGYLFYKYRTKRIRHGIKAKEYGYKVNNFSLEKYGKVQYAQWLHPRESEKVITDEYLSALAQFISEGDFVIDIGAHTGDTTLPFALLTGKTGATLSLEPNPYVFKVLAKNATLNRDKVNIFIENIAATKEEGEFTFLYSDDGFCNGGHLDSISNKKHRHRFELRVKGKNLSALLKKKYEPYLNKLSFVKIDTEGYDRDVIDSMGDILKKYQPVVVAEVLKKLYFEERLSLLELVHSLGYSTYKTDARFIKKEDEITKDNLMKWDQYDILCLPQS